MADYAFPKPLKADRAKRGESKLSEGLKFGKHRRVKNPRLITDYKRRHPRCEGCAKAKTDDAHHVQSRQAFGADSEENLIALCRRCHSAWASINVTRLEWLEARRTSMSAESVAKVERVLRIGEG